MVQDSASPWLCNCGAVGISGLFDVYTLNMSTHGQFPVQASSSSSALSAMLKYRSSYTLHSERYHSMISPDEIAKHRSTQSKTQGWLRQEV